MALLLAWMIHGVVLVALVRGGLRVTRGPSAAMRYALYWSALIVVLALPFASLALPSLTASIPSLAIGLPVAALAQSPQAAQTAQAAQAVQASASLSPAFPVVQLPRVPDWMLAIAIGLWLGVVLLALLRIALGIDAIHRLKQSARAFPAARERRLTGWMEARQQGRLVELRLSDDIASASFLGLTRPVIAVSPALAATLSDEELDLTILHEFAHVQRRDDWSKLAQLSVMAVCGWHPAVRLLDRAIDLERESACDDWVVRATGSPRSYARCLVKIADTMPRATAALVPGAHGAEAPMETRIKRLLDRSRARQAWAPVPAMASAFTMAALALLLSHVSPIAAMVRTAGPATQVAANGASGAAIASNASVLTSHDDAAALVSLATAPAARNADAAGPKVEAIVASNAAPDGADTMIARRIPRLMPAPVQLAATPALRTLAFTSAASPRSGNEDVSTLPAPSHSAAEVTTPATSTPAGATGTGTSAPGPAGSVPGAPATSALAHSGADSTNRPAAAAAAPVTLNASNANANPNVVAAGSFDGDEAREETNVNAASGNAERASMWGAGAVGGGLKNAGAATSGGLRDASAATGSGLRVASMMTGKATSTAASKTSDGLKSAGSQAARAFKRAFGSIF